MTVNTLLYSIEYNERKTYMLAATDGPGAQICPEALKSLFYKMNPSEIITLSGLQSTYARAISNRLTNNDRVILNHQTVASQILGHAISAITTHRLPPEHYNFRGLMSAPAYYAICFYPLISLTYQNLGSLRSLKFPYWAQFVNMASFSISLIKNKSTKNLLTKALYALTAMTQTRYLSAALFFMIQKMHGPLMMLQLWRPAFNRVISAKKHFKNTYPLLHLLLDISLSLALYNQIMTVLPKILTLCLAPFGIWQTPLLGAILFGCNTALAITALFYVLPVVVTSLSTLSNFVFRQPAVANSFSVPASSYNYSKNIVSMSTLAKKDMAQEIVGSILHQREAQEPVVLRSLARLFDITEVLSSLRLCFFPHNIALPLAQELNARGDIQRPSLAVIPINVMDDCLAELRAHNIIPKPCLLFTDPQGATRIIDFNTNEELNNHLRNN